MFNAFCGVPFNGFGFQNGYNGFAPNFMPNSMPANAPTSNGSSNSFNGGMPGPFFGGSLNGWSPFGFNGFGSNGSGSNGFGGSGFPGGFVDFANSANFGNFGTFGGSNNFDWNAFSAGCAFGCSAAFSSFTAPQAWSAAGTNGGASSNANPVNPYGFAYPFGMNNGSNGSNAGPVNGQQAA